MIEDTKILMELRQTNEILLKILEVLEQGSSTPRIRSEKARDVLSDEEKQSLEFEIDLEWWFMNYGEESLPAKYMCTSMGIPTPNSNPYNKDEGFYVFNRLMDFVEEENENGTHVFKYLGKVWCKREKNARNCFAYVPKKQGTAAKFGDVEGNLS